MYKCLPQLSSPWASTVCRPGRGCGTCWPVRSVGNRTSRWRLPWNPPSPRWSRRPSTTRMIPSTYKGRSTLYNSPSLKLSPFYALKSLWRPQNLVWKSATKTSSVFVLCSNWRDNGEFALSRRPNQEVYNGSQPIHYQDQNREQSVSLTSTVTFLDFDLNVGLGVRLSRCEHMMGTIETTGKWLGWSPPSNGLCTIKETETDVKNDNNGLYRSGTVNSKFHFIRSFCGMFCYHFPIISCLKCTVNSYFHLS